MHSRHLLWVLLPCAVIPACSTIKETAHNVVVKPITYHFYTDNFFTKLRSHVLAKEAWQQSSGHDPAAYSKDYAKGFEAGYAEFLDLGGSGTPPPVPPRCYWKVHYQTPEGHQAIQDWYSGYAQGAEEARASGMRALFVIPAGEPYVADRLQLLRDQARQAAGPDGPPPEGPADPEQLKRMPKRAVPEPPQPVPEPNPQPADEAKP